MPNPNSLEVYCPECQEWRDSESIVFLDVSEDIQGRDVLKFACKWCGETNESYVRGR